MGATKTMITTDIAFEGMRVCRGRDWDFGDQDGKGAPGPGTIRRVNLSDHNVVVDWDFGSKGYLYWTGGLGGKYHLYLWEDSDRATSVTSTASVPIDYLNVTSAVNVGDKLIFMRHWDDSDSRPLILGKEYEATHVFDRGVHLKGEGGWHYCKDCFIRSTNSAAKETAKAKSLSIEDIEFGDEVRMCKPPFDATHMTTGAWYKVKSVRRDSTYPVEIVREDANRGWFCLLNCFDEVRRGSKLLDIDTTIGEVIPVVGMWAKAVRDVAFIGMVKDEWYKIEKVSGQSIEIRIPGKSSYWTWTKDFTSMSSTDPTADEKIGGMRFKVGDSIKLNYASSDYTAAGLIKGNWYRVVELSGKNVFVQGLTQRWICPVRYFDEIRTGGIGVDTVREKMATAVAKPVDRCRIYSDGSVIWHEPPQYNEHLICTHKCGGFETGTVKLVSLDVTLTTFRPQWESGFKDLSGWAPKGEGLAFLEKKSIEILGKATTSASISKQIKTKKDDTTSDSSSSIRGHILRVQGPSFTIKRGSRKRGDRLQSAPNQARLASRPFED